MIKFRCKNCGQRLGVPEIHAGKKSKCPKCKNIFVVPQVRMPDSEPSDELTLLDVPEEYKVAEAPGGRDVVSDNIREDVRRLKQELGMEKEEPIAEHKLPWIIDIFLYPASKAGLITLGFIVGIPLLFKVVIQVFGAFTIMFPPLLVFLALFVFVSYTVRVILFLYLYWYFCECIRDSAIGGLRAPETMGITPVLGDMFWQLLRILACLVFLLHRL